MESWAAYDAALRRRGDLTIWAARPAIALLRHRDRDRSDAALGLKVFGKAEWHLERHGGQARRSWRKLHLAVDPNSGEILASGLTSNEEEDASLVGPLLGQITRPIGTVLADGTYDGEPVYRSVAAHSPDAEVIIPPRSTAVPSATPGDPPSQRDRHIQLIAERGAAGLAVGGPVGPPLLG